jgi:hypothetical protein
MSYATLHLIYHIHFMTTYSKLFFMHDSHLKHIMSIGAK